MLLGRRPDGGTGSGVASLLLLSCLGRCGQGINVFLAHICHFLPPTGFLQVGLGSYIGTRLWAVAFLPFYFTPTRCCVYIAGSQDPALISFLI